MKTYILLFMTMVSVFSFNSFAQEAKVYLAENKTENAPITSRTLSKRIPNPPRIVKSYHVEENINLKFGGYTITYNVSDPSLINTNDLGPNNTRVVTTRFTEVKQHPDYRSKKATNASKPTSIPDNSDVAEHLNSPSIGISKDTPKDISKDSSKEISVEIAKDSSKDISKETEKDISKDIPKNTPRDIPKDTLEDSSKKPDGYANIVMIKTYERVAEKGYKSKDIFQKLGNAYYYNAEMAKAAKWYGKLFAMTSALEPEYYYRYAQSLKAIGQSDKANQMLRKFNQLSGNNTR